MLDIIAVNGELRYIDDFLALPGKLYDKSTITQNEKDERDILEGMHILSGHFKVYPFLLYKDKELAGRFLITLYQGDTNAYFGYFECIDSAECAKAIFDYAKSFANAQGCQKLVGPYDASFWIKYRLKTNYFDKPYVGEPYNKDYYYKMFLDNGFTVLKRYISNKMSTIPKEGSYRDKFVQRYNETISRGCVYVGPTRKTVDKMLEECHDLFTQLYCTFPGYKPIGKSEFTQLYSHLKYIAGKDLLKMAYCNGKPVGFYIAFPDYSNSLYKPKLGVGDYLSILTKRIRAKDYVWLYTGAVPEQKGLGKGLCNSLLDKIIKDKASMVMALIKDDNINSAYLSELIDKEYEYVLMECPT